jgi:hypothetical protein
MYARFDPDKRRNYNQRYYERHRERLLQEAAQNRARIRLEHKELIREWAAAWGHRAYPEPGDTPDCWLVPGHAVNCTGELCRCPFCRPVLWPGFQEPPGGDFSATPEYKRLWDMLTGKIAPTPEVLQAARTAARFHPSPPG